MSQIEDEEKAGKMKKVDSDEEEEMKGEKPVKKVKTETESGSEFGSDPNFLYVVSWILHTSSDSRPDVRVNILKDLDSALEYKMSMIDEYLTDDENADSCYDDSDDSDEEEEEEEEESEEDKENKEQAEIAKKRRKERANEKRRKIREKKTKKNKEKLWFSYSKEEISFYIRIDEMDVRDVRAGESFQISVGLDGNFMF